MSFLSDLNLNDAVEYSSVPEGEYELRILNVDRKVSANTGGEYVMARLEVINEPYSKDINHVMMLPTPADDVKKKNNRMLALVRFLEAFGFDPNNPPPPEEMIGATGYAFLVEEEDSEYGKQNRIRRFPKK